MTKSINYKPTTFACRLAGFIQAPTVNLAPLLFAIFNANYGVSLEKLGRLVLICFVTQFITDAVSVKFADKLGYRVCAVSAHVFILAGQLMMALLPLFVPTSFVYISLCLSVVVYSVGAGIVEVLVTPIVERIPSDTHGADIVFLHAFYCWGCIATVIISTFLLFVIGEGNWFILPLMWAVLPLINIFIFLKVPMPPQVPEEKRMTVKEMFKTPVIVLAFVMMFAGGASELSMSQWASMFAEKALGLTKVMGDLLGPCLFAFTMGIGRTLYGLIGHKLNLRKTLMWTAALTLGCYLAAALGPFDWLALAGCALCGFGISIMWPGTLAWISGRVPTGGTALFALGALAGDIGCSVGPYTVGLVSDLVPAFGIKAGLLAAAVFPVCMIVCCIVGRKSE